MFDFAGMAAQEYSQAIAAEHEQQARRGVWRMRLHDLIRLEKATKSKLPPVQPPERRQLKGAHSPWI
jgi:hypothetical protein